MKRKKIIRLSIIVVAAAALFFVISSITKSDKTIHLKTVAVSKGDVEVTVSATGTIQAIQTVEVGTQVSGVIDKLNVDFNSIVKKGDLMAVLDTKPLQISLAQSAAQVESAKAELVYQQACYDREKVLFDKSLSTRSSFEQAEYNLARAKASLQSANADYQKSATNLNYAYIYSPIDGVVLDRQVEKGQTVAASFSTPTLFTIVNDLTRMQVEVNIDEADIGMVKTGQIVEFTVDAFPDEVFSGEVSELRLNPVTTSNVVTYIVIVNAPNPEKKLMPGMTASIEILVESASDTELFPAEALQFFPTEAELATYMNQLSNQEKAEMEQAIAEYKNVKASQNQTSTVWVKSGNIIKPVAVETGIENGISIQLVNGGVSVGDILVTGFTETATEIEDESSGSPFMPTPPKH